MYQGYKDPLNKKFVCKHCGKVFRTRQGLSGHIQWKHGAKQKIHQIDADYLLDKLPEVKIWEMTCGLPTSTIQATKNILATWLYVRSFCESIDIDLNKQDFKSYLIASLASVHGLPPENSY